MTEPSSTWTMTKSARQQAVEKAISRTEIARALAEPDSSTPDAERPRLHTLIRLGLVLVVDVESKIVLAVIEVNARARERAQVLDDLSGLPPVEIRRRPVPDRPTPAPTFPAPAPVSPSSVLAGLNGSRKPALKAVPRPTPAASPVRRSAPALVDSRVLDGVHPAIAAGVKEELRRRGLDFRSVVVHGPTNVEIRRS